MRLFWLCCAAAVAAIAISIPAAAETALEIALPLGRTNYQTNEMIDVSVLRTGDQNLQATELAMTLTGDNGSTVVLAFPLKAANGPRAIEHLVINGWLLRPGIYQINASAGGATAKSQIGVYNHVRKTSFRLIQWGSRAEGAEQGLLGEDGLGYNLNYASYGGISLDDMIRAGTDFMRCCSVTGGHQMNLRMECDWSDSYVIGGAAAVATMEALRDRTAPNCIGVHFHDEPGLTWWKHAKTDVMVPFNLPSQDRSYRAAFGEEPPQYFEVDPDDPAAAARWHEMNRWKLGFMDAMEKISAYGVYRTRPDFIPCTQSVYGFGAYADGYYFNVTRSLPVISGHGGYSGYALMLFNPSYTFEFGRMRDLVKPNWYLPSWWRDMAPNQVRAELFLSFINNLQGMATPPDQTVQRPTTTPASEGIVESNKTFARLGTIFTTMPVTRPKVALLYSMSQNLQAQIKDMVAGEISAAAYQGGGHSRGAIDFAYLAGKLAHVNMMPVVEEDVLDGTLAMHGKAILLPGINYLDPKVIAVLEGYAAKGGLVVVSDDSQVKIKNSLRLGVPISLDVYKKLAEARKNNDDAAQAKYSTTGALIESAMPVAKALLEKLAEFDIGPDFDCDNPEVIVSHQGQGDIDYYFMVNTTFDGRTGGRMNMKASSATIALPRGPQTAMVYDAVLGSPAADLSGGKKRELRFGPGQMKAFARTARPVGGVLVHAPAVFSDYTVTPVTSQAGESPVRVEIAASLVCTKGQVLSGSAPVRIRVLDPLGNVRYDLYRATRLGTVSITLPLAVNDPPGEWTVEATELLSGTSSSAKFTLAVPAQCGAIAGARHRAVIFANDAENVFKFFRAYQDVTIVKGSSDYMDAAADRIVASLAPWSIRCMVVKASDVNEPRQLPDEAKPTWVGLNRSRLPSLQPGQKYNPIQVGFAVQGPVILLGNPDDNPLIKFLADNRVLPYPPDKAKFPGPSRGCISWQRDMIGIGQESVALIAYDAAGLSEAAGTMYEIAAGLEPLMPHVAPAQADVGPATTPPPKQPAIQRLWSVALPDRASIRPLANGTVAALSQDGTLAVIDSKGKVVWQQEVGTRGADQPTDGCRLAVAPDAGTVAVASHRVAAFSAKGKRTLDEPLFADGNLPPATFVAVSDDGASIAAGATDGRITLFTNGKRAWTVGGVSPKAIEQWRTELAAWQADKPARDKLTADWQEADKQWQAAPAKDRGQRPQRPKLAPQPQRPAPDPIFSAAFVADGATLVALAAKDARLISTADGSVAATIPGVNGNLGIRRLGANFLVSDGSKPMLLSPVDGKIASQVPLPVEKELLAEYGKNARNTASVFAPNGDGLLVGCESTGLVYALKSMAGQPEDVIAWRIQIADRLPKYIAPRDGIVAVACWGGTLQLLDAATGKVMASELLPQDITGLAWMGDLLAVGLSDGQIAGLWMK